MRLSDIQEDTLYFNRANMFTLLEMQRKESDKAINSINPDTLLNTPTADVVEDIVDKYKLEVPILLRNDAHLDPPREVMLTVQDYGRTIHPTGTLLTLHVPFAGDAGMFWVQPSTYDSGPPRGTLNGQELILRMRGTNLEPAAVEKHFNSILDDFERYFNWQRGSADQFLAELIQRVRQTIEARKARLLADRNMVANLPFKIKARGDSTQTYVAPLKRKQMVFQREPVSCSFKPEPVLAEADYQHILKVFEGMTQTMERNPSTFTKLDEEALRDMYLVPLNGHFEGAATGETFNAEGKTDILIRVEDRNIFIGECKIWRGPKYFTEAIDQLLGYLTWRDTKTAIIVFNRNKGLSAVLKSVQETLAEHPHLKKGPTAEDESRFRCVFRNPSDPNHEVIVTTLVFDVPT
jgi:hypothetical protein